MSRMAAKIASHKPACNSALWADNPIGGDEQYNYSAIIELAKIGMGEPDEETE